MTYMTKMTKWQKITKITKITILTKWQYMQKWRSAKMPIFRTLKIAIFQDLTKWHISGPQKSGLKNRPENQARKCRFFGPAKMTYICHRPSYIFHFFIKITIFLTEHLLNILI